MAGDLENTFALKHPDLVSVIMPAYNAEKYISDAIDSVIKQTYTNWELIVIDDGSTDQTAAIVKVYLINDKRIKYIYQDNGGQGKARNNGLGQAQGIYVAFLDADDLWLPEKLLIQTEILSGNKADLIFSDAYVFEGQPDFGKRINITPGNYQGEEAVHKFLICNHVPILTVLTKRSAIENANGFSELKNIHEDYHLWIRLLIAGHSFLAIDTVLAHYRVHPASASAGEGKMLFYTINCLQDIKMTWPRYSSGIDRSLCSLINDHLGKVNISRWDMAGRLLEIRNRLSKEHISISFWKRVYLLFGKNVFRVLFNLKTKKKATIADDKKLKVSVV